MGNKKLIFSILVVVVVFGGFWLVLRNKDSENNGKKDDAKSSIVLPREIKKADLNESGDYYTVEAYYPETENKRVNDVFVSFLENEIKQFKEDTGIEVMSKEQAEEIGLGDDRKYVFMSDYQSFISAKAYNYAFTISLDTGGAHPNQYVETFSFNDTGEKIDLSDLFKPDANYLQLISNYVQKELNKKEFADSNWIKDGAGPQEENYQNFIIEDDGIEFIFDPYQVAPYAYGIQKVKIPFTALKAILLP